MFRSALIGLGNIAWKYDANAPDSPYALTQAGAMRTCPEVQLVGGCALDSRDREGFADWSGGLSVFNDPQAMLLSLRPDLVGICSPTAEHFEHARLCIESGVRMLWLEKPPTSNLQEFERLLKLVEERGVTVCINYTRRYLSSYKRMRDILQSEELGPCRQLRLFYSPGLARNGIHLLDQCFFMTGMEKYELLWVEKGSRTSPAFTLRLENGLLVLGAGGDWPYHTNDISAVCDSGVVSICDGGAHVSMRMKTDNPLYPGFYVLTSLDDTALSAPQVGYMESALNDLLRSFADSSQPQSSLLSAYPAQRLLDEVLREAEA